MYHQFLRNFFKSVEVDHISPYHLKCLAKTFLNVSVIQVHQL